MSTLVMMVVNRLKEPSTYAGLAALLPALGLTVSPDKFGAISAALAAVFAAVAMFLPERKA